MKYLCLGYRDNQAWAAIPEDLRKSLLQEQAEYDEVLRKNGHFLDGRALEAAAATTLRFESGKVSILDGPFFETKEPLGGVMVIDADDLNHAIQLMSQLPCMRPGGCLEIRPIAEAPMRERENER